MYIIPMVRPCQTASGSRINARLFTGLILCFMLSPAIAQLGPPEMPLFEANAPQIGEQLPDITVHDDMGNPVNLRELASENHKVLVLGCLT